MGISQDERHQSGCHQTDTASGVAPRDYYEPEYLGPAEIMLRRVPEPIKTVRRTKAQALAAIERSRLRFTASWDELRLETRE
jgi:hypothetical protein